MLFLIICDVGVMSAMHDIPLKELNLKKKQGGLVVSEHNY